MRLLILTQKMDERDDNLGFFHRWVEEFAQQCERVTVVCLYEGTHHLPNNVRVLSLGKEDGVSRIKYLRRFYTFAWRERKNYDAVFVHMNQIYVILGGLLWRMLGKRIGLWYAHGKTSLSLRAATIFSHHVFTSTPEGFRIQTPKRVVVGQGIDSTLFVVKKDYTIHNVIRLVTAGRVTPAKHIEDMIGAVGELSRKGVSTTLDIIGSGDTAYVESLKERARQFGVENQITFVGGMPYKELCTILANYDVFVNLGTTGSLDKAILDAAAAGLPVVTTNPSFGGIGVVTNDPIGAIDELRKKTPDDLRQKADAARAIVRQEHSLQSLVPQILAWYSRS